MNSPAADIQDLLNGSGLFTEGTNLFIGKMPDTPHECVCVYDIAGMPPNAMIAHDEFPMVTVHVRGERFAYANSYSNCRTVITELHRKANYMVDSSVRIISILSQHDPIFLGYDEKERPTWSMSFLINRTF